MNIETTKKKYIVTVTHPTLGTYIGDPLSLSTETLSGWMDILKGETSNMWLLCSGVHVIFRRKILDRSIISIKEVD